MFLFQRTLACACVVFLGINAEYGITPVGVAIAGGPNLAIPQHSTFDGSLDGWTLATGTGTLNWEFANGNPRGFARFVDGTSGSGFIIAPSTFHGDWSTIDAIGVLTWSHKVLSIPSGGTIAVPLEVVISGPGGSARYVSATPASSSQWVTISTPVQESSWTIETGTWDSLIQDVTSLQIRIEVVSGGSPTSNDIEAIDNVILYATPSTPTMPRSTTFDVEFDGWAIAPGTGTLTIVGSGGNPGGYAQFTDSGPGSGYLQSPNSWLGNWTILDDVGILSWDHRVDAHDPKAGFVPFEAILTGPGGAATFTSNQNPSTSQWIELAAPIRESDWVLETGSWGGLLQNITSLQVRAEVVGSSDLDIEGVDNLVLQRDPSVPAVSTWGLLVLCLFTLIAGSLVIQRQSPAS